MTDDVKHITYTNPSSDRSHLEWLIWLWKWKMLGKTISSATNGTKQYIMWWKEWKAFWWDVPSVGHWNRMGFSLVGGTELSGQEFAWKGTCLCGQPGEPSARLNTGISVCCRLLSNPCLRLSQTLLRGPDPLPKLPFSWGRPSTREGRRQPWQSTPTLKSIENIPKIVTPHGCCLCLTSEMWQHSQQIIGVEVRIFLIPGGLYLSRNTSFFSYFIIWKRFSVEMSSGPNTCDVAELILGLLSARISQPQDWEGEGLCFLPLSGYRREELSQGNNMFFFSH